MSDTWYVEAVDHNYSRTGIVWDYARHAWVSKKSIPGFVMFEGAVAVAEECGFSIGDEVKITKNDLD